MPIAVRDAWNNERAITVRLADRIRGNGFLFGERRGSDVSSRGGCSGFGDLEDDAWCC